ncbi:unnamed protein product [Mytilus coruscus]|uniref:Uncharacterized protein n=1 Tax=Mytilus coruscus TaxID=42192 RepID=A0A6J8AHY2_MYTCO|nr:unnamed protein product [Mytilus coruscus]
MSRGCTVVDLAIIVKRKKKGLWLHPPNRFKLTGTSVLDNTKLKSTPVNINFKLTANRSDSELAKAPFKQRYKKKFLPSRDEIIVEEIIAIIPSVLQHLTKGRFERGFLFTSEGNQFRKISGFQHCIEITFRCPKMIFLRSPRKWCTIKAILKKLLEMNNVLLQEVAIICNNDQSFSHAAEIDQYAQNNWISLKDTDCSKLFEGLGLDSLKNLLKHHDKVVKKKDVQERISAEVQTRMDHGTSSEIHAVATLVSKILPIYYPDTKYIEEGAFKITHDGKPFILVSPDGSIG